MFDSMYVIIGLLILITVLMPWVHMIKIGRLKNRIDALERHLVNTSGYKPEMPVYHNPYHAPEPDAAPSYELRTYNDQSVVAPTVPKKETQPAHFYNDIDAPSEAPFPPASSQDKKTEAPEGKGFEFNLATKLPVWIGALSLICAGFFLVKFSIDAGLFPPVVRVILAGMMGAAFITGGQWLVKRPTIDNHLRLAQGCIGAGLVTLYFAVYASVGMYALISSGLGFALMAAITASAIIFSLRHGQQIALFGVMGGLLTPALVATNEPNAAMLFSYLFLMFAGMLFVMVRNGWWLLASAALVGTYAWIALFIGQAFDATDLSTITLFITALSATTSLAVQTSKITPVDDIDFDIRPVFNICSVSAALITFLILGTQATFSMFDWSLIGLLSVGGIVLMFFKHTIYRIPVFGQMMLTVMLFGLWCNDVTGLMPLLVGLSLMVIYGALPYFLMRQTSDPRPLAVLQMVALTCLYTVAYYKLNVPMDYAAIEQWMYGGIGLVLALFFADQAQKMRVTYLADATRQDHMVGIYVLGSTAALALGLTFTLPYAYLPLAFAIQVAAMMYVYHHVPLDILPKIMTLLLGISFVFNFDYAWMFADIIGNSIFNSGSYRLNDLATLPLDKMMIHFILPTLMMIVTLGIQQREKLHLDSSFMHTLYGGIFVHILSLGYIFIQHLAMPFYTGSISYDTSTFITRGVVTASFAGSALAIFTTSKPENHVVSYAWAKLIMLIVFARLVYFDLFMHNPYYNADQYVGDLFLMNGVTLTYGLGTALSGYAVLSRHVWPKNAECPIILKILAGLFLFALVTLTIRQFYHGGILENYVTTHAEFYTYSVAWLVTGIALLGGGLMTGNQTLRQLSLVFMVITVGKVFLFDAAELPGLFRVFSFLGLGLSLMGLSYLYTKALRKQGNVS